MPLEFLSAFSLANVIGGIVEGRSDTLFHKAWLRLKENLAALTPDANHDLQRAVNCSYYQATLQVCAIRCEQLGIDVDAWLRAETLLDAVRKPEEWLGREPVTTIFSGSEQGPSVGDRLRDRVQRNRLQERMYSLLNSEEVLWLDSVLSELRRRLSAADDLPSAGGTIVPDEEVEGLLRPKGVKAAKVVEDLRAGLVARVGRELEAGYGAPSDEISSLIERHWFDFFCANFQYALKHDERVFRIFMAKSQANLRGGLLDGVEVDGAPLTLEQVRGQVEALGGELGRRIERCAGEILKSQGAGFDEVRRDLLSLLPIVALVSDSSKIIERLPDLLRDTAADIKVHTSQVTADSENRIIAYVGERFDHLQNHSPVGAAHVTGEARTYSDPEPPPDIEYYLRVTVAEFSNFPPSPFPRKNISLRELASAQLVGVSAGPDGRPEIYPLPELIDSTPRFVVVGPGGSGKTTALRWLTYTLAEHALAATTPPDAPAGESLIPVFVDLLLYDGSLTDLIEEFISVRGVPLRGDALRAWIKLHKVILLLDGYNLVDNTGRFRADLSNLLLQSPEIRYVITSRPVGAAGLAELDAPRFEMGSLYDYQIRNILTSHLGEGRGFEVFRLIESRGLLDSFRRPLMAELVSLAYREANPVSPPSAKGHLFEDVVFRVLSEWESQRSEESDGDLYLKLGCLARLGYEMVLRGQTALEARDALNCCASVIGEGSHSPRAAELLDQLISAGFLVKSKSGAAAKVSFWHQSFGEYFAAAWLKSNYRLGEVLRRSWEPQWHETIVFLAGLLEDEKARRLLHWLLRLARLSAAVCERNSYSRPANQLFLTLRCLANTRRSQDDLKDRFVDLIAGRRLFLNGLTAPAEKLLHLSESESAYLQFDILVGQLGTPRSRDYLLTSTHSRRYRLHGLAQFREIDLLMEVFKEAPDEDTMTDTIAAGLLLKFPHDVLLFELGGFLEREDGPSKKRLLNSISYSLAAEWAGGEGRYKELENSTSWYELLTPLVLTDKDSGVRNAAFSVITNTAADRAWLPPAAEPIFLKAVHEGDADARGNAVWYLVYAQSRESLQAAVLALDDESSWVSLKALDMLRLRDPDHFPDYVVKILRRNYSEEFDRPENLALLGLIQAVPGDENVRDKINVLTLGTLLASSTLRLFSVRSLATLGVKAAAPVIAFSYLHDEEERVREEALWGLTRLVGGQAEAYLSHALDDQSSIIRRAGVWAMLRKNLPGDVAERLLHRLRIMMTEDPSKEVRDYAKITVQKYDGEARPA